MFYYIKVVLYNRSFIFLVMLYIFCVILMVGEGGMDGYTTIHAFLHMFEVVYAADTFCILCDRHSN